MTNRSVNVDLSNYVENGEWRLVDVKTVRNNIYYSCCRAPYPDVTFTIIIQRRVIYYLYNVIFPCLMMSALTVLLFYLPPDSGEKITMGISIFLAFSVFMLTVAEDLPETSEFIPLLSIYLTIVMGMTSISVIMTVFVLNLHHRGPNAHPVPPLVRRLFLPKKCRYKRSSSRLCPKCCASEFYVDDNSKQPLVKHDGLPVIISVDTPEMTQRFANRAQHVSRRSAENAQIYHKRVAESATKFEAIPNGGPATSGMYVAMPSTNIGYKPLPAVSDDETDVEQEYHQEVLQVLKQIHQRSDREDNVGAIVYEWRLVALGVDRLLFWIFLLGTLTLTIVVLVAAPLTKCFG